ncbi:head-tail connector protein [Serratia sp. Ag1]|uniref:head-tail connector protein n=1 Tax=Serratia sp. Ag1 TaxID=1524467 RepID=UPI0005009406|nr:head-tail connector protein [Serratia sp. Ag1]KFK98127.1 phage gp6-like head-tail connector family protein [Serratia sp. Ag1]
MVPTLEELRLQCRIDHEDPDDDKLLTIYAKAARKKIENFTNRKLYDTAVPGDDAIGLLVDDDIKLAVMLLVGFWYENRETVNIGNISTVLPYTFEALVEPYRFIPL